MTTNLNTTVMAHCIAMMTTQTIIIHQLLTLVRLRRTLPTGALWAVCLKETGRMEGLCREGACATRKVLVVQTRKGA